MAWHGRAVRRARYGDDQDRYNVGGGSNIIDVVSRTCLRQSRAIYVATDLGIPDLLASGPKSSTELATATKTHPLSLRRLMRALCAVGIFRERELDRFDLAPMGNLLRKDMPGSQRARVLFQVGDSSWRVWGELLFSVRTGDAAFEHVLGMQTFDYLASHPEEAAIHDQAMAGSSA